MMLSSSLGSLTIAVTAPCFLIFIIPTTSLASLSIRPNDLVLRIQYWPWGYKDLIYKPSKAFCKLKAKVGIQSQQCTESKHQCRGVA